MTEKLGITEDNNHLPHPIEFVDPKTNVLLRYRGVLPKVSHYTSTSTVHLYGGGGETHGMVTVVRQIREDSEGNFEQDTPQEESWRRKVTGMIHRIGDSFLSPDTYIVMESGQEISPLSSFPSDEASCINPDFPLKIAAPRKAREIMVAGNQ